MLELCVRGLRKEFKNIPVIQDLSFECRSGEFVVILGPSGSGKTTTLKIIAGLIPPDAGEILIDGKIVNKLEPARRNVAMAFENYALYPHLGVYENLAYPLLTPMRASTYPRVAVEKRVMEIARLLKIDELLQRKPNQLSGGQQQRVALGRALIREDAILLLDEAISHLDARLRNHMRGELKHIQKEFKRSVVFATPDQAEAMAMADRVVVISRGKVHQIGTPMEIYSKPMDMFVAKFVGNPPMNLIQGRLREEEGKMYLRFSGGEILLPQAVHKVLRQDSLPEGVVMGIRPSNLTLSSEKPTTEAIRGEVYVVELKGRTYLVTIQAGEEYIDVITPLSFAPKIHDNVWISIKDEGLLCLFDGKTGKRLIIDNVDLI